MEMLHLEEILNNVATHRPVYHSEADFQHTLAWEIHRIHPNAKVRLEQPYTYMQNSKPIHVDIYLELNDLKVFIELKYKTRKLAIEFSQERYVLTDHSAQDTGRYDFIKDISRIERLTKTTDNAVGYAVLLTNDSSYWNSSSKAHSIDADFRIPEDRNLQGILKWSDNASKGTKKNRNTPLILQNTYTVKWNDYSTLEASRYRCFRYVLIKVDNRFSSKA